MNQLLAELDMLEKDLADVGKRIDARHLKNEKAQLISTMPGLSKYSGVAIASTTHS